MGLFKGKNKAATARTITGFLLRPRIGDSIRPLRETTTVFVQILALIFANQGLFPRNHPALRGATNVQLTLSEVMGTAWNNLSFEKDKLPQIILFFAVLGSIVFSVVAIIYVLFSALTIIHKPG